MYRVLSATLVPMQYQYILCTVQACLIGINPVIRGYRSICGATSLLWVFYVVLQRSTVTVTECYIVLRWPHWRLRGAMYRGGAQRGYPGSVASVAPHSAPAFS